MREPSEVEVRVMNYLINEAIKGTQWENIDKSFINYPSVRSSIQNWKLAFSGISHQLKLNPKDLNGYSVTPKWVKEIYVKYRNSDTHEYWKPNEAMLESVYDKGKGEPIVDKPAKPDTIIGWCKRGDNQTINILNIEGNTDFKKGYLKAMGAYKLYRIKREEIGFDAL